MHSEMGTARMGRDPKDLGAERLESVTRCAESLCDRWRVHGVLGQSESVDHVYGAHR